jgi:hypothetical protein
MRLGKNDFQADYVASNGIVFLLKYAISLNSSIYAGGAMMTLPVRWKSAESLKQNLVPCHSSHRTVGM